MAESDAPLVPHHGGSPLPLGRNFHPLPVFLSSEDLWRHSVLEVNMTRFKNFLGVAALTAGMLFSVSATAWARDWDRDDYRDRYEPREQYRAGGRDRDGRCFRRVWDPNRGWVSFSPPANGWEGHDNGRHWGSYQREDRRWRDRDRD